MIVEGADSAARPGNPPPPTNEECLQSETVGRIRMQAASGNEQVKAMSENSTVANRMMTAAALAICAAAAPETSALDAPETNSPLRQLAEISSASGEAGNRETRCRDPRAAATDDRFMMVRVIREEGDQAISGDPGPASASGAPNADFASSGSAAAAAAPGDRSGCAQPNGGPAAPAAVPVGVCVFVADVATEGDGSLCGTRLQSVSDAPSGD